MRFLGNHLIRVVGTLPTTGEPGEQVVFNNTLYSWHPAFGSWEPPFGWRTLVTATDQTEGTVALRNLYSFEALPNAIYEIRAMIRQKSVNNHAGPRFRMVSPAGATQLLTLHRPGTNIAGDLISMSASGYEGVFPNNGTLNTLLMIRGRGMIMTGAQGGPVTLSFAIGAVNGTAVITIAAKSMFTYRRIA